MADEKNWQYDSVLGWHQHTQCQWCEKTPAVNPEDDPLTVALLEAHALLAGYRPKGITASPGPHENAVAKIEAALRLRKVELSRV